MGARNKPLADQAAFGAFYRRHIDGLVRFLARRVYDPQLALDLAAETFAQAFVGRTRFRGSTQDQQAAWLYGIAKRQLASYYRRGEAESKAMKRLGIQLPRADSDELDRVAELSDVEEARSAIRDGLAHLSEAERLALRLRVVEDRPYEQVASRLGVSEQTARARVSRALRALSNVVDLEPIGKEQT